MITVLIQINGQTIFARSACNMDERNKQGETKYRVDTGKTMWHHRGDGAVVLARKMLDTIKEPK